MLGGGARMASAAATCLGQKATIVGTSGKDRLVGTKKADVIVGRGGKDTIFGKGGRDLICGDAGNDQLLGEGGNDQVYGGADKDTASFKTASSGVVADLGTGVATGAGTDSLYELENLTGSDHGDRLLGDDSKNSLNGLDGDDFIEGNDGDDVQKSGAGNDQISGGLGTDSHYGGPGDDVMDGGEGVDAVAFKFSDTPVDVSMSTQTATGEGSDEFVNMEIAVGSAYADTLTGGDANDVFYPLGGDDVVKGMGGIDQVIYSQSPAAVTVDLGLGTSSGGEDNDDLKTIEVVVGSAFNDTITGDNSANTIFGIGGDDVLDGSDGTDYIYGGAGTDSCVGETVEECE